MIRVGRRATTRGEEQLHDALLRGALLDLSEAGDHVERDPSAQRPSAHMPELELSEERVEALAAFLSSLH